MPRGRQRRAPLHEGLAAELGRLSGDRRGLGAAADVARQGVRGRRADPRGRRVLGRGLRHAPGQPRFRGEDVRFLETVAGQLAVAIGRAELFSASRGSPTRIRSPGWRTGARSRSACSARSRAPRTATPLAVLLCDVDELKRSTTTPATTPATGRPAARGQGAGVGRGGAPRQPRRPAVRGRVLRGDGRRQRGAGPELAGATLDNLNEEDGRSILISCGAAALGRGVDTLAELMRAADAALYPRQAQRRRSDLHGRVARVRRDAAARAPRPAAHHPGAHARRRQGANRQVRRRPRARGPTRAHPGGGGGPVRGAQHRRLGDLLPPRARRRSTP